MSRYRILTQWYIDGRDQLEDTGVTIDAESPDDAIFKAHNMGTFCGLGYEWPRYQGAVAVQLLDRVMTVAIR